MTKITLFLLLFVLFFIFGIALASFTTNQKNTVAQVEFSLDPEAKRILQVGEETIYQADYTIEERLYPPNQTINIRDVITKKLIRDSIILQSAKAENLLPIDDSIYNSPTKDYPKRIETVQTIQNMLDQKGERIKGTIISIWFRNNDYIGPKGLAASQKIARDKITALHRQITQGDITIEEAGTIIAEDTELQEIDLAWKNNAIYHFDVTTKSKITLSEEFDQRLWALNPGEVTEVYLATNADIDPAKQYEALYYVGQVHEKTSEGETPIKFEEWLLAKSNEYEITTY